MLLPVPLGPSPGEGPRAARGLPPFPGDQVEQAHSQDDYCLASASDGLFVFPSSSKFTFLIMLFCCHY